MKEFHTEISQYEEKIRTKTAAAVKKEEFSGMRPAGRNGHCPLSQTGPKMSLLCSCKVYWIKVPLLISRLTEDANALPPGSVREKEQRPSHEPVDLKCRTPIFHRPNAGSRKSRLARGAKISAALSLRPVR